MKTILFILAFICCAFGVTLHYVEPAGTGDSGTVTNPWQSLHEACNSAINAIAAGDTVYCHFVDTVTGTGATGPCTLKVSGTAALPITIAGRNAAWTADSMYTMIGKAGALPVNIVFSNDKDYYIFKNLTFSGASSDNWLTGATSDQLVFYRCVSKNSGASGWNLVTATSRYCKMIQCESYSNTTTGISGGANNSLVIDSKLYLNGTNGWAPAGNTFCVGSLFYKNGDDDITIDAVSGVFIGHNTFTKNVSGSALKTITTTVNVAFIKNRIANQNQYAIEQATSATPGYKYYNENTTWANGQGDYLRSANWSASNTDASLPFNDTANADYRIKRAASPFQDSVNLDWNLSTPKNWSYYQAGAITRKDTIPPAQKTQPNRADVRKNTVYASTDSTGVAYIPMAKHVRYGIDVDTITSKGTLRVPGVAYVLKDTLVDSTVGTYVPTGGGTTIIHSGGGAYINGAYK